MAAPGAMDTESSQAQPDDPIDWPPSRSYSVFSGGISDSPAASPSRWPSYHGDVRFDGPEPDWRPPPTYRGFRSPGPTLDLPMPRKRGSSSMSKASRYSTTGPSGSSFSRSNSEPIGDSQGPYVRQQAPQMRGFYLIKFAVSTTAGYFAIQLLISFREVLLPFIFAVLCMIVLEPIKRFVRKLLEQLSVRLFQRMKLNYCLERRGYAQLPRSMSDGTMVSAVDSNAPYGYGEDEDPSPQMSNDDAPQASSPSVSSGIKRPDVPAMFVKRTILFVSILFCVLIMGRVLWLTAKVFFRAGWAISADLEYYRAGANRLKTWIQRYIHELHAEALDWEKFLDDVVAYVEEIGTAITENVLTAALQSVVTMIFLLYMLWSPVKMESGTMTRQVFHSTERYLKVKCLISACTGISTTVLLWACGLDLPAAFGFLAFLANFLPGIGSFVASTLPCILGIIDVRKTPTQVLIAFVLQMIVHFCIDFFIEPVFFGMSAEIHSVIVILGIWFFYEVWGIPGMLVSVPLLAVVRLALRSMRQANSASMSNGEDADTIVFLDSILEGRWMSTVGGEGEGEGEEMELSYNVTGGNNSSERSVTPETGDMEAEGTTAEVLEPRDLWAVCDDIKYMKEVRQFYEERRVCVHAALLGFAVVLLTLMPL